MLIDTGVIIKLDFDLCGKKAIFLLASYLEAKYLLNSIIKHVPFLIDFLIWHKDNNYSDVTQVTTTTYISLLYENKSKSYADVIRSYLRSFCLYLMSDGLCEEIKFDFKPKGKEDDPNKPHKVFNYYKYLGVSKKADLSEIKKAYHNKARSLHPDMNQDDPNATDRVMALNKVYDTLKNENTRLAYDVTMGFADYDDDYLDSLEGITWHEKNFYFVWI